MYQTYSQVQTSVNAIGTPRPDTISPIPEGTPTAGSRAHRPQV